MIDFEFSRQFSKEEYITGRRGTPSYAAPELMKFRNIIIKLIFEFRYLLLYTTK